MTTLHEDPCFTFRFADDRIIPRFHLEGVEAGRRVSVFKINPGTGERLDLLVTAGVGEGGWVDLPEPIIVRAGEAFIAVPGQSSATPPLTLLGVVGRFAICKLPPDSAVPAWGMAGDVFSVTRTVEELSVVCRQEMVPSGTKAEVGWRCLRVAGAMPFTQRRKSGAIAYQWTKSPACSYLFLALGRGSDLGPDTGSDPGSNQGGSAGPDPMPLTTPVCVPDVFRQGRIAG